MKAQAILILMSLFSFVAAWAQAPAKAAEGTVKGSFTMNGKTVPLTQQACEQVVDPGLANTLANAMSQDDISGTAAGAARATG